MEKRTVSGVLWETFLLFAISISTAMPTLIVSPERMSWPFQDLNVLFGVVLLMCALTHSRLAHLAKLGFAVSNALLANAGCVILGISTLWLLPVANMVAGYLGFLYWSAYIKETKGVMEEWITNPKPQQY